MSDPSVIDPLSGCLNRQGCLRMGTRLTELAQKNRQPLAALWLNLDRFRKVNDSLGLGGGDSVIAKLGNRLSHGIGHRGHVARMSADEFAILAPMLRQNEAQMLAAELLSLISAPLEIGAMCLHPTASIGVACLEYDESAESLLQRAEHAMLDGKHQGGAMHVLSGEEKQAGRLGVKLAREELEVEHKLHAALEIGGLYLHYQPIVTFDGRIEAIEALMRCELDGELIPPSKFIPVAEKTGLVVRLGEWCLLQAALQAKRLLDLGIPTKIAVNVSRVQLTAPKFSQALYTALLCSETPPALLELEITESLFMDISELVQSNLRKAIELGVSLSIDDFGTGYSCLATLKDIPAGKLKLDRAFIAPLPDDKRVLAVVRAITQLGRELGMTVVAEGVENLDQLHTLQSAGVDAIQGYLHARPMGAEEITAWLQHFQQTHPESLHDQ